MALLKELKPVGSVIKLGLTASGKADVGILDQKMSGIFAQGMYH